MTIYNHLGIKDDPIYLIISKLKKGETKTISNLDISLNNYGFYEVSNECIHEAFNQPEKCYKRLLELIS